MLKGVSLPPEDLKTKALNWLFKRLAELDLHSFEGLFKATILLLLLAAVLIWLGTKFLEALAKVLDSYKAAGLPTTLSREKKIAIRRRRQLCSVLRADLAAIAKAESWNDLYFTDLEAEVELEGHFFTSRWNRMALRRAPGLRRLGSLTKAIRTSEDPHLLLVGEAGSGKSVALRHLGHYLAERAIRSSDPDEKVPLYLNLKELRPAPVDGPDANFIQDFVLDNIRRGDADTAGYVREHWDDYRERGIWFFLFDSFDEIPAVLHAPTGSTVIRQHARALRQFLDGFSNCRGVIASREYKGPEALPWPKLRILALSEERQSQLIENSFLEAPQKAIVRRHLAESQSSLGTSPMFLTLLCRYVKDERMAPANDHDLLTRHIERLANREPDYLNRTYGLTPAALLSGAVRIASLFATNQDLSLAPTHSEINTACAGRPSSEELTTLLAALVDTKIGRSDVREARTGDRRFTFSHRRYQEALFVSYLVKDPVPYTPDVLLTESRWREYTVTLLQSQPLAKIAPILRTASSLLRDSLAAQLEPTVSTIGDELGYFEWTDGKAIAILNVLQEGLARRLEDIPSDLRSCVAQLLQPRWESGDVIDRIFVIALGGLLPDQLLQDYLEQSVSGPGRRIQALAFRQSVFLRSPTNQVARWVRERLSEQLLGATQKSEVLRLEALAGRLPASLGANYVLRRYRVLRNLLMPGIFINRLAKTRVVDLTESVGFLPLLFMATITLGYRSRLAAIVAIGLWAYAGLTNVFMRSRYSASPLALRTIVRAFLPCTIVAAMIALLAKAIPILLPYLDVPKALFYMEIAAGLVTAVPAGLIGFFLLKDWRRRRAALARASKLQKEGVEGLEILKSANSDIEAMVWIESETVRFSERELRSLTRALLLPSSNAVIAPGLTEDWSSLRIALLEKASLRLERISSTLKSLAET